MCVNLNEKKNIIMYGQHGQGMVTIGTNVVAKTNVGHDFHPKLQKLVSMCTLSF